MSHLIPELSRTFSEFLLLPNRTTRECTPDRVSVSAPLTRYKKGQEDCPITMTIPLVSAIMQAVSDDRMAVALAREGGLAFIFGSQGIDTQTEMIRRVKRFKAGFVPSDSNLSVEAKLSDIVKLKKRTGHSTVPITHDGTSNGKLLGIVTSRDYRVSRLDPDTPVSSFMTPLEDIVFGREGITLSEANDLIWDHKLNQVPILDEEGRLVSLVFRKDYDQHKANPGEMLDAHKRLLVGAGINTRDYKERVPALLDAGCDVLCIDSSDGFSDWQKDAIDYIRNEYGPDLPLGAGNVVDEEGFRFLAEAGASFIKVGIGGGSICITREQKGIGRGQASALMDVARARDRWFKETGDYIPLCSDGGIVHDYHMTLALAMGADFLMLGRYFARFDESPTRRVLFNGSYVKEYWGEGSNRARNWQRYDDGGEDGEMHFEEGVDSYVPYAGKLSDNVATTLAKIKATMCACGSVSIAELQQKARLTIVSPTSIVEGGAHDVIHKESDIGR
ncbi:MAG: IMP dehydrogenase [Clostridiales bacterium]|jgi:IMP dehydrogenase|nr:IMP dehydrogenase [Clostridiales bacterium]MDD2572588.1 IMP dehydrogenase [Eubacteriales bacterium]MDD3540809.1 IMP dehydrogenase [Eubacteriales bacterium]MDD4187003.1 IMP dehydrogenase [Eubacteriales bacterium]